MKTPQQAPGMDADPAAVKQSKLPNAVGIVAMVLGLVAIVVAVAAIVVTIFVRFAPFLLGGACVVGLAGTVCGIVALCRRGRRKAAGLTGAILSPLAIVSAIVVAGVYAGTFFATLAIGEMENAEQYTPVTVVFDVTGAADRVEIGYTYEAAGGFGTKSVTGNVLPFSKTITVGVDESDDTEWELQAISGDDEPVTCTITVDGVVVATETAQRATCYASPDNGEYDVDDDGEPGGIES